MEQDKRGQKHTAVQLWEVNIVSAVASLFEFI